MELVRRKKEKAKRRRERKMREEIIENKRRKKQTGIISAILFSACVEDENTMEDLLRVRDALKKYERDAIIDEAKAFAEVERALWIPPRTKKVSGISESFAALPWDFEDTPENRAARARYREENNITRGGFLYMEPNESKQRVKRMLGDDSSDEISAPDWDRLTYIEPSIYAFPQGDKENPHRSPDVAYVKELLEDIGCNVKCQTSLDMDKPLTMDPLEEDCQLDRETLEERLYHFQRKMQYRWCQKYPRYRAYIEREILRLEILIPHARPREIPEEEWLPPTEVWKLMEDGPEPFELPDDVAEEDYERFEAVRKQLEALQFERERRGLEHYQRLLAEGRVPPPSEKKKVLTEIEQEEAERERAEAEFNAAMAEEELVNREDRDTDDGEEVRRLMAKGQSGTEAVAGVRWARRFASRDVDWGALQLPPDTWNRWRHVTMTPLPGGGGHTERVELTPSPYNSESVVEGRVRHSPSEVSQVLTAAVDGEEAELELREGNGTHLVPDLEYHEVEGLEPSTEKWHRYRRAALRLQLRELEQEVETGVREEGVVLGADGCAVRHKDQRAGEEEEEEEEEEEGEEESDVSNAERREVIRCLARGFYLMDDRLKGLGHTRDASAGAGGEEGGGERGELRTSVGDAFECGPPPLSPALVNETEDVVGKVLRAGGEAVLDAMTNEEVMAAFEAAQDNRLSMEAHLKWLRAGGANDTKSQRQLRLVFSTLLDVGVLPAWMAQFVYPERATQGVGAGSGRNLMAGSGEGAVQALRGREDSANSLLLEKGGELAAGGGGGREEDEMRQRLRHVKGLISKLSGVKRGGGDLESRMATIRLKRLRAEAASLMQTLAGEQMAQEESGGSQHAGDEASDRFDESE